MLENIYYKSTRGSEDKVEASKAILKGIASDGGLFVPNKIPKIDEDFSVLAKMNYKELAYYVMSKFFTDFTKEELKQCIDKAYDNKFDTDEIAPLKKVGDVYFLELYHGPTLAFKDMALSILPHLLITSAKKQKLDKEIVILTATSGDTGKAALEGFTDIEGVKIIVFFPQDGVSEIQRMQMVTHKGNNTYVVAIKGNFDDAQSGVKKIFTDNEFSKVLYENNYMFSSANSINIGRLVPQIVYYFKAYLNLYKNGDVNPNEKINVTVPTGNFGNILAAYYAKLMGIPIDKLICASNKNNVLKDFMDEGVYDKNREFFTTISPSMDILISSNLERLLYLLSGENTSKVKELMNDLQNKGIYKIDENMKTILENFYGDFASEEDTKKAIKEVHEECEYLIDTHTGVAYSVYKKYKEKCNDENKVIIASTASPYKFPYSVMNAIDSKYSEFDDFELVKKMSKLIGEDEPKAIKNINKKEVCHKVVCDKSEMKCEIEKILNIK